MSSKCPKCERNSGEGECAAEAPPSPADSQRLVPLFSLSEGSGGRGLSDLDGLGLDLVKWFPPKPRGAASGPYEEQQPPTLTHAWLQAGGKLPHCYSVYFYPPFVCRVSTGASFFFSCWFPGKENYWNPSPPKNWTALKRYQTPARARAGYYSTCPLFVLISRASQLIEGGNWNWNL